MNASRHKPRPTACSLNGRSRPQENSLGHSEFDSGVKGRRPGNAGRKFGATRALKPQQVWAILLCHTKIESTVCYLGVDVEDALTLSERTEI